MHEVIPGARVEGKVALDGEDIYGSGVDPVNVRRTIGMVFQRPEPVPHDVDLRQRRRRLQAARAGQASRRLDEIVEQSLRGANLWNEVKDRLDQAGREPLRRPAAAAVHRPRHRGRARRCC